MVRVCPKCKSELELDKYGGYCKKCKVYYDGINISGFVLKKSE